MDTLHTRFSALLQAHRGIVAKVAHAYCRDAHEQQDLAQEIAAQLWRAFPRYDSARPFSTWMYRVALNVAISHVRRAVPRPTAVPLEEHHHESVASDVDADGLERDERVRALYRVIDGQPPLDRALLLLWLDEVSQREIAEVLGLTESNVSTKLQRLKQRIRVQLEGLGAR
jgi:RNA polymerase sigma-70 factor, ECF subfamily